MFLFNISNRYKSLGTKRLFLIFGSLNFILSNIFLQIALVLLPTFLATILSQLINLIIGYYLYGKKVFKLNRFSNSVFKRYLLIASLSWLINFVLIQYFYSFGINKNLTAVFIIPLLVCFSFLWQKYYVFKF